MKKMKILKTALSATVAIAAIVSFNSCKPKNAASVVTADAHKKRM
jgi:hypothetical protein